MFCSCLQESMKSACHDGDDDDVLRAKSLSLHQINGRLSHSRTRVIDLDQRDYYHL